MLRIGYSYMGLPEYQLRWCHDLRCGAEEDVGAEARGQPEHLDFPQRCYHGLFVERAAFVVEQHAVVQAI
nr:hypothetical protein orf1 [uncultured archaeon]